MKLNKDRLYLIIIVLLCFISFFNILGNDFVWDDEKFIVDRPEIQSFNRAIYSFVSDQYEIYRPVRTLAYATAFQFFRLNPLPYHLLSILMHSAVSVLLFFIIKKLFNRKLAFFSAILFAVHPIHVSRVTNATASFDIIGLLFYLISFYLYILFREKKEKNLFIASLALFIVGLFASEEVFTLPLLLILYEFVFNSPKLKEYLKDVPYFIFLVGFLVLRFFVLRIGSRVSEYPGGSFLITLMTIPKVLAQYVLLIFFPFGLTPFRGIEFVESVFNIWFIVPVLFVLVLLFLIFKFRKNKELIFFSGWFFITLLPFLNILPLPKIIAERYFYLASLSVIVLIVKFVCFMFKKDNNKVIGLMILFVIFFASLTIYNNGYWVNDFILNQRGIELNPFSSRAHNNLGNFYFKQDNLESAGVHFTKAIETDIKNEKAWINLGVYYTKTEEYDKSIEALEQALVITPNNYQAMEKLGVTYMRMGDNDSAEQIFKEVIDIKPSYYRAYSRLAALYGNKGNYSLSMAYLMKSIEINPYYAEPYYNLGVLYEIYGKKNEARQFYLKAYQLDPTNKLYASRLN